MKIEPKAESSAIQVLNPQPPPTTETPAENAPAAPPTEAAAPPPEEDAAEPDPFLNRILRDMGTPVEEPQIKPAEEQTPPAAEAPAAPPVVEQPAAAAQAAPAAEKKPSKKKRLEIPKADIESIPPQQRSTTPKQVENLQLPPAEEAAFIASLSEDRRDELLEAEVAERIFPDRHKGFRARLLAYYKHHDEEVRRLLSEDSGRSLDPETDDEYARVIAKKPVLPASDTKRVLVKIGEERAAVSVRREIEPQIQENEMKVRRLEVLPKAEKFATAEFRKGVATLLVDDEESPLSGVAAEILKGGDVGEDKALEKEILTTHMDVASNRVKKFILIVNGAERFNPATPQNPAGDADHAFLSQFITEMGQDMLRQPARVQMRNGKRFIPREKFLALSNDPEESKTIDGASWTSARYWTFDNNSIIDMLAVKASMDAKNHLKTVVERVERYGYKRSQKKELEKPATPPQEITPPSARPSPQPGAGAPAKQQPQDVSSPLPAEDVATKLFGKRN